MAQARGIADHGAQASNTYRTKPLPALGDVAEHQVVEEFRRIERTLEALYQRIRGLEALPPMRLLDPYAAGSCVPAGAVVVDGGWTMTAKVGTCDRAAPQASGPKELILPDNPSWATLSNTSGVRTGHLYTFVQGGWFGGAKGWAPELTANTRYRFVSVVDPFGANPVSSTVEGPTLNEDAWTPLIASDTTVVPGTQILIYIDALNSGSSQSWQYPWTYAGTSNTNAVAGGHWNSNVQQSTLRINYVDGDSTSHAQELDVIVDTVFYMTELGSPESLYTFRVTGPGTDTGTFWTYPVTLIDQANGGPTVGVGTQIRADQPIAEPTRYVELAGYWPGGNPTWATVQGFKQFDGVDVPGNDNTAFGIDIAFTPASVSPDWKMLSHFS